MLRKTASPRRILESRHSKVEQSGKPAPRIPLAEVVLLTAIPVCSTLLISTEKFFLAGMWSGILATFYIGFVLWGVWRDPDASRPIKLIDILLSLLLIVVSLVQMAAVVDISNTKLVRLGMVGYLGIDQFSAAYLIWIWSVTLGVGSTYFVRGSWHPRHAPEFRTGTAIVLLILGFVGTTTIPLADQQEAFVNRGQASGGGLRALLYWSTAVYVVYVTTYWRKGLPYFFPLVAIGFGALLFLSANRSPIALVLIALLVRSFSGQYVRTLVIGILCSPLALLIFSYQSTWRGLVAGGSESSPGDVLSTIYENPLIAIQRLGFDSIDGMVLSRSLLERGYPAQYLDPLIAVVNFIPRQLWEGKPVLLGSTIGWDYLGLSAGGIFLSGPGYTSLVTGTLAGGIALFVVLILGAKLLLQHFGANSIAFCAILYFSARFPIAGDSFDIFLALQVVAIYAVARLIDRLVESSLRGPFQPPLLID